MSDSKTFLKEMFINEAKPALERYSGGSGGGNGEGLIEVTELPEVGKENTVYKLVSKPTIVPNSGYVEKIYFNTSKTYESFYNLFEQLDYIEYAGSLVYPILFNPEVYMLYMKIHNNEDGVNYGIYYQNLTDGSHHPSAPIIVHEPLSTGGYLEKWHTDFIEKGSYVEVNNNVINNLQGINIGLQNDLLRDFVSIGQSFEAKEEYYIYEQSTPTEVPNEGVVNKVYFNTKLNINEVVNIVKNVSYPIVESKGNIYGVFFSNDMLTNCVIVENNGSYSIWDYNKFYNDDVTGLIFSDTTGWSSSFNGVITINNEVRNSIGSSPIGNENDKLTELFSTTPFGSGWKKISGGESNNNVSLIQLKTPTAFCKNANFDTTNVKFNNPDNIPIYRVGIVVNLDTFEMTAGELELFTNEITSEMISVNVNILTEGHGTYSIGVVEPSEQSMVAFFIKHKDLIGKTIPYFSGIVATPSSTSWALQPTTSGILEFGNLVLAMSSSDGGFTSSAEATPSYNLDNAYISVDNVSFYKS